MKCVLWTTALALLSFGAMAPRTEAGLRTIDDPPPEPVSCPLCGGDPQLHVQRLFAFSQVVSRTAAHVVRW